MRVVIKLVASIAALLPCTIWAAPLSPHESGGEEHIVLIDNSHPLPPRIAQVLDHLNLSTSHPDVLHVYNNSAFRGFSAKMRPHCLDLLQGMASIAVVEKPVFYTSATFSRIPVRRQTSPQQSHTAPWGLQRISSQSPIQGPFGGWNFTYTYMDDKLGEGADIYIVDSGVNVDHIVFQGRASNLWSYSDDTSLEVGHGTHVAGTAAGNDFGVARKANVFSVKVLNPDGRASVSDIIAGINAIVRNHDERQRTTPDRFFGSVMSMSLSGNLSASLDIAVQAAVQHGIHTVVAAGNSATDACQASPALLGGSDRPVITVGAIGMYDQRSSFSNYGDCVDIYAPGEHILSSWIGANNLIMDISGTSMATPHITGLVASAMSDRALAQDPARMKQFIRSTGQRLGNGLLLGSNGMRG